MYTRGIIRAFLILGIILVNIGCDQVSKKMVRQSLAPYETVKMMGNHITLTNVENPGAFLSLGSSMPDPARKIVFTLFPLLVLAGAVFFLFTRTNLPDMAVWGLCFIIGGGAGNIFDRMTYGSVTDFLHIDLGVFRTGIFNLADVSIVIGTLILLLQAIFKKPRPEN